MDEHDEIYGDERSDRLKVLLRDFADAIRRLDDGGRLLSDVPRLLRSLGDIRTELFHYEVRSTYDTPEVARNRRIVDDARDASEVLFDDKPDDEEPWRQKEAE